jgi:oxygen-independent coproporphyrinogen III oxidase
MAESIAKEIEIQANYLKNKSLQTIYFGGGTPSLLDDAEFNIIFEQINKTFTIAQNPEITIEANPDDLTNEKLQLFRKIGINRLSIGVQSFDENHLKLLHRVHNAQESETCIKLAQDTGFQNLTIDLIYGIPTKTHDIWHKDLEKATNFGVNHISAYCLTIEPKTVFGKWLKQGKIQVIDDEFSSEQYDLLIAHLEKNNFEQYEISNFAKNGQYARHNSSYWQQEEYLGVGPSAHSFDGDSRQFNVSNNQKYIQALAKNSLNFEKEILSKEDKTNEYLMTGLRSKWGVNLLKIKDLLSFPLQDIREKELTFYLENNTLILEENILRLSPKGKLLADRIASELFV